MKALGTMKKISLLNAVLLLFALNVSLMAGADDDPTPTDKWINAYGDSCLLNGQPLPVGAIIQAYDQDGILCGKDIVREARHYGFMPVYRDDLYTDTVEGASQGEPITLKINGLPTTHEGPDSIYWSKNGDPYKVNLSASQVISMNLTSPAGEFAFPGQVLTYVFQVENTGSGIDLYDLEAVSQHGWTATIDGGTPSEYADAGEIVDISISLAVPSDIFVDITDTLSLTVTSRMDNTVSQVGKTVTTVVATSAEDEYSIIPDEFSLSQNFPNPFNPETVISYSLEKGGEVRLIIYNILGQPVDKLVDEHQDAGNYRIIWNSQNTGRMLPSGVYFYRLNVGELTLTRKMVLLK
ncbi:MAG: T9SS type A sorting domain-containing protein [candidate division Zixibacteria bacterium]|nr:T9SS type A sorting domain-containing protein [candidate division Zixibacteria bacterium]NIT53025.1 T9SS type A sorting domain-containing protein [candidate division Zixibacteria bacterium]NIW41267.1 T9SS type A sorting domain-containing protein [candidate division Zixibacteria bacterium]NIX56616.1 T9SS type A sorting domain-containing protein [candidate division Zixibacteria bacterium]